MAPSTTYTYVHLPLAVVQLHLRLPTPIPRGAAADLVVVEIVLVDMAEPRRRGDPTSPSARKRTTNTRNLAVRTVNRNIQQPNHEKRNTPTGSLWGFGGIA